MVIPFPSVGIARYDLPGGLRIVKAGEYGSKAIAAEDGGVNNQWSDLGLQNESVVVLLVPKSSSRPMTVDRKNSRCFLRVSVLMSLFPCFAVWWLQWICTLELMVNRDKESPIPGESRGSGYGRQFSSPWNLFQSSMNLRRIRLIRP